MDILRSGIPSIKVNNLGTKRKPLEVIEATIVLTAWDGYLIKRWENGKEIADRSIKLDFGFYDQRELRDWRPVMNAYHRLLEAQGALRDNIVKALIKEFDRLKVTYYLDANDPTVPSVSSDTDSRFDFSPFIGPRSLSFNEESKNDVSYVDWYFNCTWDPEHGLAVTTYEEKVIDIDQGETDIWKIYADKGTLEGEKKAYEQRMKSFVFTQSRPWWKFW